MGQNTPLQLAEHVVADGFDARRDELAALYRTARRHRVSDVLLEVVADDHEPVPVRERALGRIVVQLHRAAA